MGLKKAWRVTCKKSLTTLGAALVLTALFPAVAMGACDARGYSVVFVNGILTSENEARKSSERIEKALSFRQSSESIEVHLGYNQTHLGGLSDVFQSVTQAFSRPISQHDLKTILLQLHPEVSTQKILLVGHSQGSFYVNEMYEYLIQNGVPKESIGVYHIATPASHVAGGGRYVTSKNDKLINWVRDAEVKGNIKIYANSYYTVEGAIASALRANIEIAPEPGHADSDYGGHSFGVYMNGAGDRIVSDMQSALSRLSSSQSSRSEGCFNPPDQDISYKMQAAALSIADPIAEAAGSALGAVKSDVSNFVKALVGSKGWGLSLLGKNTTPTGGSASQLAAPAIAAGGPPSQPQAPQPSVSGSQPSDTASASPPQAAPEVSAPTVTEIQPLVLPLSPPPPPVPATPLFAISPGFGGGGGTASASEPAAAEDVDAPPTAATSTEPEVSEPVEPPDTEPPATTTLSVAECADPLFGGDCVIPVSNATLSWDVVADADFYGVLLNGTSLSTTTSTTANVSLPIGATSTLAIESYDAAGNSSVSADAVVATIAKPLIINEVGWAGTDTVSDQWIEIKNISPFDIPLDGFAVHANGSLLAALSGTLPSGAYLVVEQTSAPFSGLYKIITPFTSLSTSVATQLSLVWGGQTIDSTPAADTCAGWCAGGDDIILGSNVSGLSNLYMPLSMERVADSSDGTAAGSWRSTDSYGAYLGAGKLWGTPGDTNSSGLPEDGVFCGTPQNLAVANQPFNPAGGCTYLTKFVTGYTFGARRAGGLYRGVVASSTQITGHSMGKSLATITADAVPADAIAGEDFFFAMWENRTFGNDTNDFNTYFTLGTGSPPHGNYVTIPWIYAP